MSISDLNHFMTYVIEGWMLFSAGFIGTTFVSFVSRRIQEDLEAAALAEGVTQDVLTESTVPEAASIAVAEGVGGSSTAPATSPTIPPSTPPKAEPPKADSPSGQDGDEPFADEEGSDSVTLEADEAARLEEVAAVSEQLAKNRGKQSDSSSVSVST